MPVLVVQMGHCYRKSGSTGTTGEQAYATSVANACVNLLHGRNGWTVRRILADDNLSDYRGGAFVAIHCDGSTSASARGASIGYRNAAGRQFGQAWKRAYAARGWKGGFRPDNYTAALAGYYGTGNALSQGNTRAFIAECGFMTNAQDRALLTAPGGPSRVALAIGDALGINSPQEDNDMQATDPSKDPGPNKWGHEWLNTKQNAAATRTKVDQVLGMLKSMQSGIDEGEAQILGAISGISTGSVDVTALADALSARLDSELVADLANELDRRARDGNPNTGPVS